MEKEQSKKPTLKVVIHWLIQVLGTFLFVFFMMAVIVIFTTGMRSAYWVMPLFVIPSCMVCITFGANYWIGENKIRLWSYCISNFIAALILVPTAVSFMTYSVSMMMLRIVATILLPIIPVLYGIRKVKKKKPIVQPIVTNGEIAQVQRNQAKRMKVICFICLISICCVLFENWNKVILFLLDCFLESSPGILLPELIPFPLSILSAILLAKFMKAECVQRNTSFD